MPTLYYFRLRARAEPLRMMMRFAGIPFVDREVTLEDWPTLKEKIPPNASGRVQLPVLELDDGTLMPDSLDIAKWIAEQAGPPLLPTSSAQPGNDAARLWELCDARDAPFCCDGMPFVGIINPILNFFEVEEAKQRLPPLLAAIGGFLDYIGPILSSTQPPFFGGTAPHYADFLLWHYMNNLSTLDGGTTLVRLNSEHAVAIRDWYDAVARLPAISNYVAERPPAGSGMVGRSVSVIYNYEDCSLAFEWHQTQT